MGARRALYLEGPCMYHKTGFVDSASLYEVIIALTQGRIQDLHSWSRSTAQIVTPSLVQPTHLEVMPPPDYEGAGRSGYYGSLVEGLQGFGVKLLHSVDPTTKNL